MVKLIVGVDDEAPDTMPVGNERGEGVVGEEGMCMYMTTMNSWYIDSEPTHSVCAPHFWYPPSPNSPPLISPPTPFLPLSFPLPPHFSPSHFPSHTISSPTPFLPSQFPPPYLNTALAALSSTHLMDGSSSSSYRITKNRLEIHRKPRST